MRKVLLSALTVLGAAWFGTDAQAACPAPYNGALSCASPTITNAFLAPDGFSGPAPGPGSLAGFYTCPSGYEDFDSQLGETFSGNIFFPPDNCLWDCGTADDYHCGSPVSPVAEEGPEDIYPLTCTAAGNLTVSLTGLQCDLDLYIMGDSCDPATVGSNDCIAGGTQGDTSSESVTFTCIPGTTYYAVVEGWGHTWGAWLSYENDGQPGYCYPESGSPISTYNLSISGAACAAGPEDCNSIGDEDGDGNADCDDSDCATDTDCNDNDGDGYCEHPNSCADGSSPGDCNDGLLTGASQNPGRVEACNNVDDDCNGQIDDGLAFNNYWPDGDGDTFGNQATAPINTCTQPGGMVGNALDCDDSNATVFFNAPELCDGISNDCDGEIDEGLPTMLWYIDSDGDGFGDENDTPRDACLGLSTEVVDNTDCDDADSFTNPGAFELCDGFDNDCNTVVDDGVVFINWYPDVDGDLFGDDSAAGVNTCDGPPNASDVADSTDCDDLTFAINPNAVEACNGIDDDCDGQIDNGLTSATYWPDTDGDGYGDTTGTSVVTCTGVPSGFAADDTDCNDNDSAVNPGEPEVCNGIDDDCDGTVDNGQTPVDYWPDTDTDGFGDQWAPPVASCSGPPVGHVADNTDCNDNNGQTYPGATEVADWQDNNCDALQIVDEGTIHYDDDGDGYTDDPDANGDGVPDPHDCDDANATVFPGAVELCDGLDNDCDGTADNNSQCWDDDGDGFCEDLTSCAGPAGAMPGDCNDTLASVAPGLLEIMNNGIDDNCDGSLDGVVGDTDGDGFVAPRDCDESDPTVHNNAPELPDGLDNDCDGVVDEGTTAYDDDGDGFSEQEGDCDDRPADPPAMDPGGSETYPGALELENGHDDDCDGIVDEFGDQYDDDGDGFTEEGGDCDDADATTFPGAPEIENGEDDDCDGEPDDGLFDRDGDGFTVDDGDCDDRNGFANPATIEICDFIDNNCDGTVDEGCGEEDPTPTFPVGGCQCSQGSGPAGVLAALPLLALIRRRAGPPTPRRTR